MALVRTSNLERQKWRVKCREELSKHIRVRLGIAVEPPQVRLIPGPDDLYRWSIVPEKEHLFSKNLSDHSIGAYKELCESVGKLFEAVASRGEASSPMEKSVGTGCLRPSAPLKKDTSFSAKIDRLREERSRLNEDAENLKAQLSVESRRRQEMEAAVKHLEEVNQRLREQHGEVSLAAESYVRILRRQSQGLLTVIPILEGLRKDISREPTMSNLDFD